MDQPRNEAGVQHLVRYARDRVKRLDEHLGIALAAGEVESVHAVRVASRRLVECLSVMTPWLHERSVDRTRRDLRRLRRSFRLVRDLDVLQASLAASNAAPMLDTADMAQLEGLLTRRREKALNGAQRDCRKSACHPVLEQLADLIDRFERVAESGSHRLCDRLTQSMDRRGAQLLALDPRGGGASCDLHPLRIAVKRIRYTAELVEKIGAGTAGRLISDLTDLQDRLGLWNDHLVAARYISQIARRRRVLAEQPAWATKLFQYAAMRLEAAESERAGIRDHWTGVEVAIRAGLVPKSEQADPTRARPV